MIYFIFNTLEEAQAADAACFESHMAEHTDSTYLAKTQRWCNIEQRITDDKYIVPVCTHYSNINDWPIEESRANWFPVP